MATRWEIVRIPEKPSCASGEQATVHVVAAVVEPKVANALVRQLSQVAALENLRHVKRVRRRTIEGKSELSVILCPTAENEDHVEGISSDVLKLILSNNLCPFITKVAKYAASSKEEWEDQCKLWPTSYHPPTNIDGVSGFSDEDSQLICNFMKLTIELTKVGWLCEQVVNAAVIVDPSSGQIVASATDQTFLTTTDKCQVESAICIKSSQVISPPVTDANESTISKDPSHSCKADKCSISYTGVSCLYPWNWMSQQRLPVKTIIGCGSSHLWHPLRHAALVAIENAAARDRRLFPNLGCVDPEISRDEVRSFSPSSPAKRQKTMIPVSDEKLSQEAITNGMHIEVMRPYLCTGYDIYLVWEPCPMCAMALVHQRVRRIFYAFPNPNAGALGSVCRLQGEKSLNHHYYVFRIMIPEDVLIK